jgi:hypothetical protein
MAKKKPAPRPRPKPAANQGINVDAISTDGIKVGTVKVLVQWLLGQGARTVGIYLCVGLLVAGAWNSIQWMTQHEYRVQQRREEDAEKYRETAKKADERVDRLIKYTTESREKETASNIASREKETTQTTMAIKQLGETFERGLSQQNTSARETINILKELIAKPKPESPFKRMTSEERSGASKEGSK